MLDTSLRTIPTVDYHVLKLIQPNLKNGPWIAGGAAIRWFNGNSMNSFTDIDVFFQNQYQFQKLNQQLENLAFRNISNNQLSFSGDNYHVCQQLFRSDNAITYGWQGYRIQLINRSFYQNVNELLSAFDIVACKIATDGQDWATGHPDTIEHIQKRILDMVDPLKPNAIKRFFKYWIYGFRPREELIAKLKNCTDLERNFASSNDYDHI